MTKVVRNGCVMRSFSTALFVFAVFATLAVGSGCKDNKDPLTPDNPSADPLMLDAGMPGAPDNPPMPSPSPVPAPQATSTAAPSAK